MLTDQGSISQATIQSQDGLNLGDIRFCPIRRTLHMQHLSLDHLHELIVIGMFMHPTSEGPPKLSGTTTILLIFQGDDNHERIMDVYVWLMVHCVDSCLYKPDQILDFVADIKSDLQAVHDSCRARGDPSKRHTFCLFVSNYGGTMSIPMNPPYYLVYPTNYVKDMAPDHFNTRNNLAGTCLHHCICHATLQYMNNDPN